MNNQAICYLPLYGIKFDSDKVGFFATPDPGICRPGPEEWMDINKSDVWKEMIGNNPSLFHSEDDIPPCLTFTFETEEGESAESHLAKNYIPYAPFIWDPILSLRLYKDGSFFNPQLAQQMFSDSLMKSREPGPYRQYFVNYKSTDFEGAYQLSINELMQAVGEEKPLNQIYEMVTETRQHSFGFADSIIVRNFNISFGHFTKPAHKCSALFTCLEGLTGGMKKFDKKSDSGLKLHYTDRLFYQMAHSGVPNAKDVCQWLDDHKAGARFLRNNIAHGNERQIAELAEQSYPKLQTLVRILLKQYLLFLSIYGVHAKEIDELLDISQPVDKVKVFNRLIETFISNDEGSTQFQKALLERYSKILPL